MFDIIINPYYGVIVLDKIYIFDNINNFVIYDNPTKFDNVYSKFTNKFPLYRDNSLVPDDIRLFITELQNNTLSVKISFNSNKIDNTEYPELKIRYYSYPLILVKTTNFLITMQEITHLGVLYGTFKKYT